MEAGQGAAEQARRMGERVSRLETELEQARKAQQAWLAGAEGEARVGEQLRRLEPHGWRVLHDVHWPGRQRANIDHLAIGPGGILMIDAKNWSGDVRLRDGELSQNGYARKKETASLLEQCSAVAVLLEPQHRTMVQAWICLVGQPDLEGSTSTGGRVVGIDQLVDAVLALPPVLEEPFVNAIHDYLEELLAGSLSPAVATTALLDRSNASSAALSARRVAAARPTPVHRIQADPRVRSTRPVSRRRQRNQKGCLDALWCLVTLALVLLVCGGALQHIAGSLPAPPSPPVPGIEQPASGK
ncbi:hypothetical protein IWX63_002524 [Arthrobacter sp. CAN_A2]|uniref:nuclease-related domain-containing protein n=1 Tax=Arthrobacter sp. CAN_A2 TaxID=2787718 RepID=UPI0018EFE483